MSTKSLKLKTNISILEVSSYWPPYISFNIKDLNGVIIGIASIDQNQAQLLKLFLEEHCK